jgi:hypothetical protein
MGAARGRANHHSHCARLLLDAWADAEVMGQHRRPVLADAYGLAVQVHLRAAYGWFVLELAQCGVFDEPVDSVAAVRELGDARWRAELSELAALEADPASWLGCLLGLRCRVSAGSAASASLAVEVAERDYSLQLMRDLRRELEQTMARMSLVLEEW